MPARAEIEGAPRRCRLVEQKAGSISPSLATADRGGVERRNVLDKALGRRQVGEIALADDDAVGQRHLLAGFGHFFKIAHSR